MGKKKADPKLKDEVFDLFEEKGLDVAEDSLELLAKAAFALLSVLIPKIVPGWGMFILPILKVIEPKIMKAIDKIDGKTGN